MVRKTQTVDTPGTMYTLYKLFHNPQVIITVLTLWYILFGIMYLLVAHHAISRSRPPTASTGAGKNRSAPPGAPLLPRELCSFRGRQKPATFAHGSWEGAVLLPWEAGPPSPLLSCRDCGPAPLSLFVPAPAPGGWPEPGYGGSAAPLSLSPFPLPASPACSTSSCLVVTLYSVLA